MEVRRKIRYAFTQVPGIKSDIDETPPKPDEPVSPLPLTAILISLLIQKQNFTLHEKSGGKKSIELQLSPNLLNIYIVGNSEKHIQMSEITNVEESSNPFNKSNSDFGQKYFYFIINTVAKCYLLSSSDEKLRNEYVSALDRVLKTHQEFQNSNVLKNYCERAIETARIQKSLAKVQKTYRKVIKKQEKFKKGIEQKDKALVKDIMNCILTQVEVFAKSDECKNYEINANKNSGDVRSLRAKQEEIRERIKKKEEEIEGFQGDLRLAKEEIHEFYKKIKLGCFGVITGKIWQNVVQYLNCRDVFALIGVSRRIRRLTSTCLSVKSVWRGLILASLIPRKLFYRVYMQNFYRARIRGVGFEIDQNVLFEIHNDVWNGLNEHQIETEEIIIGLCKYNPSLEYCQGMHFVSNFLYILYKDSKQVVEAMDSLCRPPFYLSELWKNDFSRLKLGIHQLDFLMKVRLPLLSSHLKRLEIPLDMIVSRWFLTVFTHLYYQFDIPFNEVLQIWDIFLVYGWSGLLSTCLAIFYLNEEKVLDKCYEETLLALTSKSSLSADLFKVILKFLIEPRLLEDLDSSYASIN